MITTSYGKEAREFASRIYRSSRQLVDAMVREGKIPVSDSQIEWAKMVAKDLKKYGLKVPQTVQQYL